MAYPQKTSWGSFNNPQFNRLQGEIERQTQALLRQRNSLTNNVSNYTLQQQSRLRPVQSQKYIKLNSDRSQQYGKERNVLNDKVRELVQLCKNQNSAFGNQLIKVLGQERNIYNEIASSNSNRQSSQKTQYFGVSNPIIQAQKQSSVIHGSRQQLSNLTSGNQSPNKVNIPPKSNIRQALENNPKIQVGDDLIQMIEEIQRKALNQIQKLREQKIDLMKQLKTEIQSNNQLQKQVNVFVQHQRKNSVQSNQGFNNQTQAQRGNTSQNYTPFKQYTQQQDSQGINEEIFKQIRIEMDNLRRQNQSLRFGLQNKPNLQQTSNGSNQLFTLRNRLGLLQGELRNRDQLINSLSAEISRLNQHPGVTSSDPQQIAQLLQQGESIRQNTIHLIRLKGGQGQTGQKGSSDNNRIHELQQLLQKQEFQKQSFLNDLLSFKQKYQQLEEQNRSLKRQSKFGSGDLTKLSPIYQKSTQNVGASLDEYQRLLNQMRGNTKQY